MPRLTFWLSRAVEYLRALRSDPKGFYCGHCGAVNDNFDDAGWWYAAHDAYDCGRPTCLKCFNGPLGDR
jgi:hypothetical protein